MVGEIRDMETAEVIKQVLKTKPGLQAHSIRGRLSLMRNGGRDVVIAESTGDLKYKVGALEEQVKELKKENEAYRYQILSTRIRTQFNIDHYFTDYIRFGLLADTQLGSTYENIELLQHAYDIFVREGIENVYHSGDMLEGTHVYRGQEFEMHTNGLDAQVDYAVENYPQRDGITTRFIDGNHDISFWKRAGVISGMKIAERRDDIEYMGQDEADITLSNSEGKIVLRLVHPRKGTAYALSYQPQKYIESLTGGHKPNLVAFGHYHKAEHIPIYRNVESIQVGCMQAQTPFMRGRNIAAIQGFYIVELMINNKGIVRCKSEFFPCYD